MPTPNILKMNSVVRIKQTYEANFIQGPLKKNEKKLAFNFTFHYIDDVLSLNNSRFGNFVDRIYPIELDTHI
jgi:hypothetical protein